MKKTILKLASWVVVVSLIIATMPASVSAAGTATMSIDPQTKTVGVNEVFSLAAKVGAAGQEVDTAQAFLNFNPAHLQVLDVTGEVAKPNLIVLEKSVSVDLGGGTYNISFVIKNIGTATAPAGFDVALFVTNMTTPIEVLPIVYPPDDPSSPGQPMPLTAGATASGTFAYVASLTTGTAIKITVDQNTEVAEKDETDNSLSYTYSSGKSDLIVTGTATWKSGSTTQYVVSYSVKNIGAASTTVGHYVALYVDNMTTPVTFTNNPKLLGALAAGASSSGQFAYNVPLSGGYDTVKIVADSATTVDEENEGNNTWTILFPSAVVLPGSTKLTTKLSDTVDNVSGKADFVFGVPTGGTPENAVFTLGTVNFKAMAAATDSPVTFNTDLPRASKAIRSGADVTATGGITGGTVTIQNLAPDLVIQGAPTIAWVSEGAGTYTVSYTVRNAGSQPALQPFKVGLYLDGAVTPAQENPISSDLAGGASTTGQFSVTLGGASDTVVVTADSGGQVAESDESNNSSASITWPTPMPDLIIFEKSETWVNETAGTYHVNYTVKNIGNAAAAAGHDVALYVNGAVSPVETKEITGTLAPGASASGSFAATLTLSSRGSDIIVVTADKNTEVTEKLETNNSATNIWPSAKPDLIISQKSEAWVTNEAGGTYTVSYTITNQGTADAVQPFSITLTVNSVPKETKTITANLAAGASTSGTFAAVTKNPAQQSDNILVTVDSASQVTEGNENNNTRTNIFPEPKADLIVLDKTEAWVTNEAGGTYTVNFTIKNQGNLEAAGFYVGLYIDGSLTAAQQVQITQAVAAGATKTGSFPTAISLSNGSDRVTVVVDNTGVVPEFNEDNNTLTNIWPVPKPDLTVVWKTEEPVPGHPTQYTVSFTVKNIGPGVALAGSIVRLKVDGDNKTPTIEIPVDLGPGEIYLDMFQTTITLNGATDVVQVIADATGVVPELDENNNTASNVYPELLAGIRIEPYTQTVAINQIFEVKIWVSAANQGIDTLQTYLNFNPNFIKVVNASGNVLTSEDTNAIDSGVIVLGETADFGFPDRNTKKVNNASGAIDLALGVGTGGFPIQEDFLMATIRFKAIQLSESTPIWFERTDNLRTTKAILLAADVTGNVHNSDVTIIERDIAPPTVLSTNPTNNQQNVPVGTTVQVVFSEPMNQTATAGAFSLKQGTTPVTGAITWLSPNTLLFTPGASLAQWTQYTLTVSTAAADLAGNLLATAYTSPFRTADTTLPVDPTNVRSTSHTISTWSTNASVVVVWTAATDPTPGSGVDGYSIMWDTTATTIPDNTKDIEETVITVTSPTLTSSTAHWFHIRTVDVAGNWTSTVHLGPFFIDTVAPTMTAIAEAQGAYFKVAPVLAHVTFTDNLALKDGYYKIDSGAWTQLFNNTTTTTTTDTANWTVPGFAGLSEGTHTVYFKASDQAGNALGADNSKLWQFFKDTVAPADPTNVRSTSHTVSTWSADNTVDVAWTAATDATSGVDGYSTEWSTSAATIPDATKDIGVAVTTATSSALADGTWYFHIRTVDIAGNWVSTVHLGPFFIDTTAPTMQTIAEAQGAYFRTAPVLAALTFTDNLAIKEGFYKMDAGGTWTSLFSGATGTTSTTSNWTVPGFTALDEGTHTIYFKASDQAGNAVGADSSKCWQFFKDTAAPTGPTNLASSSHTVSQASSNTVVTVTWTDATDALSGLFGYSIAWDTSASTLPGTTKTVNAGVRTANSPTLADGTTWYFHIRAVDNAGNWASTAINLGPFVIDASGIPTITLNKTPGGYYKDAPQFNNLHFASPVSNVVSGWYQVDLTTGTWLEIFTGNASLTRDVNWTLPGFDLLSQGSHTIYFKAINATPLEAGASGQISWQFYKDTVSPADPTNVRSTSHTTGTPSNDNTIDIAWTAAVDPAPASGLDGYSILWDTNAATIPDTTKDIEKTATTYTNPVGLADGTTWYFHIRSVDNAGNWVSTVHLGPFIIDKTAPTVTAVTPLNNANDVLANAVITATFSEQMKQMDTQAAFSISPPVSGTFSWGASGSRVLTFTPDLPLKYSTRYTVTIGTGAKDLAGNALATAYTWSFTTKTVIVKVEITPADPTIPVGKSQLFTATGIKSDGTKSDVTATATWASSVPTVAAMDVTTRGKANALKMGTTVITATVTDPATGNPVKGDTALTVGKPVLESIVISPKPASVALGKTQPFKATGTFSDATTADVTQTVTWSSSTVATASIDASGVATSKVKGTTTIKAEIKTETATLSDSTTLTVNDAELERLEITPDNPAVPNGKSLQFSAFAYYSNGDWLDKTSQCDWTAVTLAGGGTATIGTPVRNGAAPGSATATAKGTVTITASLPVAGKAPVTDSTVLTITDPVLDRIDVVELTASVAAGQEVQLHANAILSDGSSSDITALATWSSASRAIATVSEAGVVGKVKGIVKSATPVKITATYLGFKDTCDVTVTDAVLTGIAISPLNETIPLGTSMQFKATGTYSDGSTKDITGSVAWTSSDPTIASFSTTTKGLATGNLAGGPVTVTAALAPAAPPPTTPLTVGGPALDSIVVKLADSTLPLGKTQNFTAEGTYSDNTKKDITTMVAWSSTVPSIASIDTAGKAKGLLKGTTRIKATLGIKSGDTGLTVGDPSVETITVIPATASQPKGRIQLFTARADYSDGTSGSITAGITWTKTAVSGDATIATVAAGVNATGTAVGTVTITATHTSGKSGAATFTVTAAVLDSIKLIPATASVVAGLKTGFAAEGTWSDGNKTDVTNTVKWSSDDTSVASIDAFDGVQGKFMVKGLATGKATITATGSGSGTATVTVNAATLDRIDVTPATAAIPLGRSQAFRAMSIYSDGTSKEITTDPTCTWTSSATTVADIGVHTGVATTAGKVQGTTNISVAYGGKNTALTPAVLTVGDPDLQSIKVTPATPTINAGETRPFIAMGTFSAGADVDITMQVTWESDNASVARVNAVGFATSYAAGSATIKASMSGKSGTADLTVNPPVLKSAVVTPENPNVTYVAGAAPTVQFRATGVFSDGSSSDLTNTVTWASSAIAVGEFLVADPAGLATTKNVAAASTTTIKATETVSGIFGTTVLTVLPDKLAPKVNVTNPPDGLTIKEKNLTVSGGVDDINATVTVVINSRAPVLLTVDKDGNFSQGVILDAGKNVVVVNAVDGAGNAGSSGTRHVTVDPNRPTVNINRPNDGLLTKNPNVTVNGTASNTTTVMVRVNGVEQTATVSGGTFSTVAVLTEGKNIITAYAYTTLHDGDEDYKGTSGTKTVTLDTKAPVVTVTSPTPEAVVSTAGINITATVDDPQVTIALLMLNYGAPVIVTFADVTLPSGEVIRQFNQSITLNPGENTITIVTTDRVGNTATVGPITVTFDNTKPGVKLTTPTNKLVTNIAAQTVHGTVDDPTILRARLIVNGTGQDISIARDGTFDQVVKFNNGINTIEVTASDSATPPNVGTSGVITVTVDTVQPNLVVGLSEPTDSITIKVTSDEALIAPPTVSINPTITMVRIGVNEWVGTYGPPIADGSYVVTITGTDKAGNVTNKTATFRKDTISTDGIAPTQVTTSNTTLNVETNGAVKNADITVTQHIENPSGNVKNPAGADIPGAFVEINASTELRNSLKAIYIEVKYDPAELSPNTDESSLRLYSWDTTEGNWKLVEDWTDPDTGIVHKTGVDTIRKVIFGWITHLSKFGTFGTLKPAAPSGGGGGPIVIPGVTSVSGKVDAFGVFMDGAVAKSEDSKVQVTINKGIQGKSSFGFPLESISVIKQDKAPAAPPQNTNIVGITYNFGPEGTTFDKPVTICFTYTANDLPKGANENKLVLAYWDAKAVKWVELTGTTVDTTTKTVCGQVNHFTVFGILVPTKPAAFAVSNLVVSPTEVMTGGSAKVTARVTNSGDLEGTYAVALKVNGTTESTVNVTLASGASQDVSFTVSKSTAGNYSISIDTQSASLLVKAPAVPPKPAAFTTGGLSISPTTMKTGQTATITVTVTNTGEKSGTYTVTMKVNGATEATKDVTVAGGAGQQVTFSLTRNTAGAYTVAIDQLSGTIAVQEPVTQPPTTPPTEEAIKPTPGPPWAGIIGGIAGGLIVIAFLWFILRRKPKAT